MKLTHTETDSAEDGSTITFFHYVGTNGKEYILSNYDVAYLYYPTIYYLNYNLSIEHIEVSNASDHVPIYTFTYEQFAQANTISMWVNIIFVVFYLCGIVAAIVIFKKKQKAQT